MITHGDDSQRRSITTQQLKWVGQHVHPTSTSCLDHMCICISFPHYISSASAPVLLPLRILPVWCLAHNQVSSIKKQSIGYV